MGAPKTLPANFFEKGEKKKQAPKTLPSGFFEEPTPPSPQVTQAPQVPTPPDDIKQFFPPGTVDPRAALRQEVTARPPEIPTPTPGVITEGARALREEAQVPFIKRITGKSLTEFIEPFTERIREFELPGLVIGAPPMKAPSGMVADSANIAAELLDFFGSPEGVAAAVVGASGPIGAAAVPAFYAVEQAIEVPEALRTYLENPTPDNLQRVLLLAGFAALLGGTAAKGPALQAKLKKVTKERWQAYNRKYPPTTRTEIEARGKAAKRGEPPPEVVKEVPRPPAPEPIEVSGWHTPVIAGRGAEAQMQSAGLPEGKFVALDRPFESMAHDVSKAQRVTTSVRNTFDPSGLLNPATQAQHRAIFDALIPAAKRAGATSPEAFRKFYTDFLQEKGFDSYVRAIDGDIANRELIVFERGKVRTEAPEPSPEVVFALREGQEGSLRIQGKMPDKIDITQRPEDLTPIITEGFASPSQAFGEIHPSAGRIVELTIEATENIARDTSKAIAEYERVWRPLKRPEESAVIKLLDDPNITPENLSITTEPRVRDAYLATRILLDTQREQINIARKDAGLPEIEGITSGYWPHVFQGSWAVTRLTKEGKWTPIETGWLQQSQVEAANKAREYLKANPNTRLKVDLNKLYMSPEEATILPRGEYFRLVNRLSKESTLFMDPITGELSVAPLGKEAAREKLKGVARPGGRRPPRARFGHVERRRTDLSGWVQEPRALEVLIRGAERYIKMVPLRKEVAKLREQVFKELPEVEQGKRLKRQLDSYIDAAVMSKPDAFTESFNAAWERTGEAMGLKARPGALQRVSRRVNEAQSLLKLGFSPVSAFVNLSQTPINTFPVLGGKYTIIGIRRYVQAAKDHIQGKPNRYWDIVEELGIPQQATKAEEAGFRDYFRARLPRTAREIPSFALREVTDAGLFLFRHAEQPNRGIAGLGAYERAIDRGLSHADAIREARNVVTRTQFQYGPSDAPLILRHAWSRVPGQFKTFWIKEIEFMLNLKGKEVPRFISSLLATTGVAGVPGALLLNQFASSMGWKIPVTTHIGEEELQLEVSPLEAAKLKARDIPGLPGVAARALVGGLPMAAGIDIIRNVGFQEYFSPAMVELRDLWGPTGNDVSNFVKVATSEKGRERQQAWKTAVSQLSPTARRIYSVVSRHTQGDRLIDPRTERVLVDNLTREEKIAITLGFTPNRVSQIRDVERAVRAMILRDRSLRGGFVDRITDLRRQAITAYDAGDQEKYQDLIKREDELIRAAEDAGVGALISRSVNDRMKALENARWQQILRTAPRRLRQELTLPTPPGEQ